MMSFPGIGELVIVFLIIVLLFGAKKLPELGSGLGTGIKKFKDGLSGKSDKKKDDDK